MARAARSAASPLSPFLGRWPIVAAAFALGGLLFLLVWLGDRARPVTPTGPAKPVAARPALDPLPAPAPAGASTPLPALPEGEQAQLVEEVPPPAPPAPTGPESLPAPLDPAPAGTVAQAPRLLPDQPAPRYPAQALRRGESGTVVVLVEVDGEGRAVAIGVQQRSGSRDLDRAAVEAVSAWRFEPARDAAGQAVPGSITVPIDFRAR